MKIEITDLKEQMDHMMSLMLAIWEKPPGTPTPVTSSLASIFRNQVFKSDLFEHLDHYVLCTLMSAE